MDAYSEFLLKVAAAQHRRKWRIRRAYALLTAAWLAAIAMMLWLMG